MKRERGRPPGGHKTITIGAVTWSLSDLAKHLGVNLPTLAKRVRAYEDGTMALAAVLAKGRAPHEPRKATSSVSREALQKALQGSKGEIAGAAAALAGTRVNHIPVFSQFLPRQEHATYLGAGVLGERQIVSFRASAAVSLSSSGCWP